MRRRFRRAGGLQRVLFASFGAAIVAAIATSVLVLSLFGDRRPPRMDSVAGYAGRLFATSWDDDAARFALGRDVARDFGLAVRVRDARGHTLEIHGDPGSCVHPRSFDVERGGGRLGTVSTCIERRFAHSPVAPVAALAAAGLVLWAIAGIAARRLARPLRELAKVAEDLGEGRLESRARIRHGQRGEVGELARAMNEMAARIERQIRGQKELLAAVSHELRSPLARLRLAVELARDRGVAEELLAPVDRETITMDGLVGDLLASARVDFDAITRRPLDVPELVHRELDRCGLSSLGPAIADDARSVVADATLLARALATVLDNARKHGGGPTALRVERVGEAVVFAVEDAGPGIPREERERVLLPFVRGAGRAPDERGGVGLGLSLVRRIAEAHGGRVWIEGCEGGGARVSFSVRDPG